MEDFYPPGFSFVRVQSQWDGLPQSFAPFATDLAGRLGDGVNAQAELLVAIAFLATLLRLVSPKVFAKLFGAELSV